MKRRRQLKLTQETRIAEMRCVNCGLVCDAVSGVVDKQARNVKLPKPGDSSLCIRCGHFSVFDENLRLRPPTDAEIVKWAGDGRLVLASTALAHIRRKA